jgi:hypothetical protein
MDACMRAAEFSDNLIRGISLHCNHQQLRAHIATQEIVRWTIECCKIHKATFRHEKRRYSPKVAAASLPPKRRFQSISDRRHPHFSIESAELQMHAALTSSVPDMGIAVFRRNDRLDWDDYTRVWNIGSKRYWEHYHQRYS